MQNGVLILVELRNHEIHPVSYELIGKAREIGGGDLPVDCLVLGPPGLGLEELNARGCDTVYYMADDCFAVAQEELFQQNIVPFIQQHRPAVVLTGATNFGRSLAPRVAAALQTGLTADCTQLELDKQGNLVQIRPAFSGNILAHIKSDQRPQMATIRYKEFAEAGRDGAKPVNIQQVKPFVTTYEKSAILKVFSEANVDITNAGVIVAGGRGIRKKEDLQLLRELAAAFHGQLGVSRALVDAGMADSVYQVGYSGHRVKPKLYIACGISGAPQHIAGMREAETIIAVNSDPSAPIFSLCDYGMVGDLYDVVPRMIADLIAAKGVQ